MAKKTTRVRRSFTPQFKKDAVRLVRGGRSISDVAQSLGVARSLLQRWREQLDRGAEEHGYGLCCTLNLEAAFESKTVCPDLTGPVWRPLIELRQRVQNFKPWRLGGYEEM